MTKQAGILAVTIILLLAGCAKEDDLDRGTIIGIDMTDCGCCGGYVIEIDGSTYKFSEENIIGTNPLTGENEKFPVDVFIDWTRNSVSCTERITVHKIVRKK